MAGQCLFAYLLHSVDSLPQLFSRHTAGNDLQRNPIFSYKEAGGDAHHWVLRGSESRKKLPSPVSSKHSFGAFGVVRKVWKSCNQIRPHSQIHSDEDCCLYRLHLCVGLCHFSVLEDVLCDSVMSRWKLHDIFQMVHSHEVANFFKIRNNLGKLMFNRVLGWMLLLIKQFVNFSTFICRTTDDRLWCLRFAVLKPALLA